MYCKKCGQEIDTSGKFCPHCGAPVEGDEKPGKKQKKAKKPFYKRWWFWVIVVIILLGSCSGNSEAPAETTPATETVAAAAPVETTAATTEAAAVETDSVAESAATSADLDMAVGLLESVIKENFENCEIYHENGIIIVNVWQDGIAIGATLAAEGNAENLSAWNGMVEDQKEFCLTLCDFVETLGLDDTMVMVNVLNDLNKENVLLSIAQGVVISNCVEN